MHILMIAHAYPPYPVVGSLRAAKVARAFREAGHQVTVITARLPGDTGKRRPEAEGVTVRTVRVLPHPTELYRRLKQGRVSKIRRSDDRQAPPETRTAAWKRYVLSALLLPDDQQGFVLPAVARGLRVLREDAELIYTTAPPFSVHLVGLALKAATGVRWAAEFRDPWTDYPGKPPYLRSALSDALEGWLERRCLASADHVISASDAIRELLARKVESRERNRFLVIRNGIDQLSPPPDPQPESPPYRIVHVGELYHFRDPRPLLRALASFREKSGFGPRDVELEFVGHCRWYHDVSVEGFVEDLGLSDLVRFRDRVAHDQGLELMQSADLLLLFAQRQPAQVPNKLYEYLAARRPILALADEDGETARMLRRVGGHFVVDGDEPEGLSTALETAVRSRASTASHTNESVLREWSTSRQMDALRRALEV
jgi:glycosyltransferase involved in cell wall biosynthesis